MGFVACGFFFFSFLKRKMIKALALTKPALGLSAAPKGSRCHAAGSRLGLKLQRFASDSSSSECFVFMMIIFFHDDYFIISSDPENWIQFYNWVALCQEEWLTPVSSKVDNSQEEVVCQMAGSRFVAWPSSALGRTRSNQRWCSNVLSGNKVFFNFLF